MPIKVYMGEALAAWIATRKPQKKFIRQPIGVPYIDDMVKPRRPAVIKKLAQKLLTRGGSSVSFAFTEIDWFSGICNYGGFMNKMNVIVRRMELHNCHGNCLKVWKKDPDRYYVVTGYALHARDWNPHTWLIDRKRLVIINTLKKAYKYYGVILNDNETQRWYDEQYPLKKAIKAPRSQKS